MGQIIDLYFYFYRTFTKRTEDRTRNQFFSSCLLNIHSSIGSIWTGRVVGRTDGRRRGRRFSAFARENWGIRIWTFGNILQKTRLRVLIIIAPMNEHGSNQKNLCCTPLLLAVLYKNHLSLSLSLSRARAHFVLSINCTAYAAPFHLSSQ